MRVGPIPRHGGSGDALQRVPQRRQQPRREAVESDEDGVAASVAGEAEALDVLPRGPHGHVVRDAAVAKAEQVVLAQQLGQKIFHARIVARDVVMDHSRDGGGEARGVDGVRLPRLLG